MPDTASTEIAQRRHATNRQRGGYSYELDSWLTTNAVLMDERSNFAGLKAAIERGGSGGNSGTKGVGMTRVEPFTQCSCATHLPGEERVSGVRYSCPVCSFDSVSDKFMRSDRCWMAWRGLTDYERNLASARYLYGRLRLPPGVIGQLGDLAAVAYVVADRLGVLGRLVNDIAAGKSKRWEETCVIACEEMHRSWTEERASADSEAEEGEQQ